MFAENTRTLGSCPLNNNNRYWIYNYWEFIMNGNCSSCNKKYIYYFYSGSLRPNPIGWCKEEWINYHKSAITLFFSTVIKQFRQKQSQLYSPLQSQVITVSTWQHSVPSPRPHPAHSPTVGCTEGEGSWVQGAKTFIMESNLSDFCPGGDVTH